MEKHTLGRPTQVQRAGPGSVRVPAVVPSGCDAALAMDVSDVVPALVRPMPRIEGGLAADDSTRGQRTRTWSSPTGSCAVVERGTVITPEASLTFQVTSQSVVASTV